MIAKGIEAINNLTDSGNGASFSLLAKSGYSDFQKIEPEDLNVYGNEIEEGDGMMGHGDVIMLQNIPTAFEIPGTKKNDDPIYTQDSELTENQEQIFESFDNAYNENTPDPVQVIELATQVEATAGGCAVDMTNLPAGVPSAVRTNETAGVKIEIPKL